MTNLQRSIIHETIEELARAQEILAQQQRELQEVLNADQPLTKMVLTQGL